MALDLAKATALILALGLLQDLNARLWSQRPLLTQLSSGVIFGAMCVIGMMMPIHFEGGIIFDARSVVLSMAGLFGGAWVGLVAGMVAAAYRLHLGGAGSAVGLAVITSSVLLGLAYRQLVQRGQLAITLPQLLAFGALVHLVALLWFTQLPQTYVSTIFSQLALPYLLVLSPATALLGLILRNLAERDRTEAALATSEARLRAITAASPDVTLVVDETGTIQEVFTPSPALLFARADEIRGQKLHQIFAIDQADLYLRFVRQTLAGDDTEPLEYTLPTPAGERRFEARARAIDVPMLGHRAVLIMARDITERRRNEEELRVAAKAFEAQQGMIVTDANNHILRVNRAFTRITGYSPTEVIGHSTRILSSGQHDRNFYVAMWEQIRLNGSWEGEVWNRRRHGNLYPARLAITAVTDDHGAVTHYVGSLQDLTQTKQAEEEIHSLSFFDHLTALPNRRLLTDRLHACLQQRHGGAVLFIDLDDFKNINDLFNHHSGDVLLQQVAQRLRSLVEPDHTAARFGADEFVVMLDTDTSGPDEARSAAERMGQSILESLRRPFLIEQECRQISASIGITTFNALDSQVDDLLLRADLAMHEAKRRGKNRLHFFDPAMQAEVTARLQLEDDIRRGIAEQQFLLHYQPQVDQHGRISGAEALARWPHPSRGQVSPGEFIAVAEAAGLMTELGNLLLHQVCRQLAIWRNHPNLSEIRVAINLSVTQIFTPGFVDHLLNLLRETGAPAERLVLEITESLLLNDLDDAQAILQTLRAHGVRFSIDDFGTGYSSLAYLQRLPLNELKIDQSFVRDLPENANNLAIVRMVLALADALGLDVVAEGVETDAQWTALRREGCPHFQGYRYARPMPASQLESWAVQHAPPVTATLTLTTRPDPAADPS